MNHAQRSKECSSVFLGNCREQPWRPFAWLSRWGPAGVFKKYIIGLILLVQFGNLHHIAFIVKQSSFPIQHILKHAIIIKFQIIINGFG